jgi:hypothetical protein
MLILQFEYFPKSAITIMKYRFNPSSSVMIYILKD